MISLPSSLPLLRVGRYEVASYEADWLESSIREAADRAGHADWWLACDITRSLMLYLRDKFPGTAITIEELTGRIRTILTRIGFSDIGEKVSLSPPSLRISLHDLALEAEGLQLLFFQLLEERIDEWSRLGVRSLTISHSRRGVKTLQAARNWGLKCASLEQEIVGFLRSRAHRFSNCAMEIRPH